MRAFGSTLALAPTSSSHMCRSASPDSWPYLPTYAATLEHDTNSITLGARYSEHAAFVNATAGATYEISMRTSLSAAVLLPGGSGTLSTATAPASGLANITFTAATAPTNSNSSSSSSSNSSADGVLEYQLLWSPMPSWSSTAAQPQPTGCVTDSSSGVSPSSTDAKWNGNCIFWTACGAQVQFASLNK
jgi:hypothetical protein